jgi:H+/gluconate symporter-like permease
MIRRYWKMLVAVLGGNFIYFVLLYPHLPPVAQHRRFGIDLGLLIDFWICLALYGLFLFPLIRKRK